MGKWYCFDGQRATALHEQAADAIAEAYTMQSEVLRVAEVGPVVDDLVTVTVTLPRSEAKLWRMAIGGKNPSAWTQAVKTALDAALQV